MNTSDPNNTLPNRDLSGLKVLIIDDSKSILRIAEALLAEFNCWVMTASDGFEALPVIASFKPDVVFVDIMMPRLDGYQTCALIKANRHYKNIPVIMLSSKDGLFDLAKGRLAGSDKYLTKPFTREDLLAILESDVLAEHDLQRQSVQNNAGAALAEGE